MIHCSMNPFILSFVVCHYYGNTVIPEHLMTMRTLHKAVPEYVRCWLPGANQDKLAYFEVFILFYFASPINTERKLKITSGV